MPATYEPIATTTLSSAATNITFSSISSTYTDLHIVLVAKGTVSGNDIELTFNSSTTGYSRTRLIGNGTTASSSRQTSTTRILVNNNGISSTQFNLIEIDVFSYAGSTNKAVLASSSEDENSSGVTGRVVGLWSNTSAITSLKLAVGADNFAAGTTATLYGIKAA